MVSSRAVNCLGVAGLCIFVLGACYWIRRRKREQPQYLRFFSDDDLRRLCLGPYADADAACRGAVNAQDDIVDQALQALQALQTLQASN